MRQRVPQPRSFSEKEFYLSEFRSRTLAVALPDAAACRGDLMEVLDELGGNATRVVLIASDPASVDAGEAVLSTSDPRWIGSLWRALRTRGRAVLDASGQDLGKLCATLASRLGFAKLVWVEARAVMQRPDGSRLSYLSLADVKALVAAGTPSTSAHDPKLLERIGEMIGGGLPSVSVCAPDQLAAELFTYAGSGTFFTRDRAPAVRMLVVDDFDAAHDLIRQGEREGYLVPRSDDALEAVLANGFGVFIEGRYLAGIGALLPYEEDRMGEIASFYTLTRFLGEGVGGHLVGFALDCARERGYRGVFACTTSERVERFFQRYGFETTSPDAVPATKWKSYPRERRPQVRCLVHSL